jgi:hypothetical protein
MKLPWSLCPYCGTPEPGKRIEDLTVKEAARSLDLSEDEGDQAGDIEHEFPEDLEESYNLVDEELDELSDEDLINAL